MLPACSGRGMGARGSLGQLLLLLTLPLAELGEHWGGGSGVAAGVLASLAGVGGSQLAGMGLLDALGGQGVLVGDLRLFPFGGAANWRRHNRDRLSSPRQRGADSGRQSSGDVRPNPTPGPTWCPSSSGGFTPAGERCCTSGGC